MNDYMHHPIPEYSISSDHYSFQLMTVVFLCIVPHLSLGIRLEHLCISWLSWSPPSATTTLLVHKHSG